MKTCYACAAEKPLTEFHKHRGRKDGHNDVCKLCATKRVSLYSKTEGAKAVRAKFWAEYKERPKSRERLNDYHAAYNKKLKPAQREKYLETRYKRELASPKNHLYRMIWAANRRRPTENVATVDDLMEMYEAQKGFCAVSGVKMTFAGRNGGKKTPTSISLDRVDGSRGYEKDNLRLVCWQVNVFKNCWSDDQMFNMALAIVTNMRRPKLRLVS